MSKEPRIPRQRTGSSTSYGGGVYNRGPGARTGGGSGSGKPPKSGCVLLVLALMASVLLLAYGGINWIM